MPDKPKDLPDWLTDGPADASQILVLAHGAGQGMNSPFLEHVAAALGRAGLGVIRFEFPYMAAMSRTGKRRAPDRETVLLAQWNGVIDRLLDDGAGQGRLLIGGKSLGARMASLIADERGIAGLICLGYPFHPPGKPDRLRIEHLKTLDTPTLICQGTRDPFGNREQVEGYPLSPGIRLAWIEDGEHSFRPRKQSGRTWEQNLEQAEEAILEFARGLGSRARENANAAERPGQS
jgi:predicted alpha/beta-hydrolase family hydrolase